VDRNEFEPLLGSHRNRCLDRVDHHEGSPIGVVEHKGLFASAHAGLQVHHLACTKVQQLLGSHLPECGGPLISGVGTHLIG
jgi:hypothetical protein